MLSSPDDNTNVSLGWVAIMAIVGVLIYGSGIFPPQLSAARPKARRVNCAGNLKQMGLALIIYAGDDVDNGFFPSGHDFRLLNELSYLVDGKVYVCPSCPAPNTFTSVSNYTYVASGLKDTNASPTSVILAHDRIGNHDVEYYNRARFRWLDKADTTGWVNVLFLDGHVKGVRAKTTEEFHEQIRKNKWILPGLSESGEATNRGASD
jgi:prepilin-type processing-associated H-X9-DG protein